MNVPAHSLRTERNLKKGRKMEKKPYHEQNSLQCLFHIIQV